MSLVLVQGSANFLGSRAGWAPKELAPGRTGKFYVKNLIPVDCPIPLIMMVCHICKSTERKRGNFWYFVQDCFKINSTSFQLYTIFFNFTKNVPILLDYNSDRRVKCKGSQSASTSVREPISIDYQCVTKSRSEWKQLLIVQYVFRADKTDDPPRAGWTELTGRIWPAGRTLPTPALGELVGN